MKYYIYEPVVSGSSTFQAFLGKTVELEDSEEAPENASTWKPNDAPENHLAYWNGQGWAHGVDVRTVELSHIKACVTRHLQEQLNFEIGSLKEPYSKNEFESWPIQLADAQNIMKGELDSVMLHALAKARKENVNDLARKVVDKSAAYYKQYATILGKFQKQIQKVESAKDLKGLPEFDVRLLTS